MPQPAVPPAHTPDGASAAPLHGGPPAALHTVALPANNISMIKTKKNYKIVQDMKSMQEITAKTARKI